MYPLDFGGWTCDIDHFGNRPSKRWDERRQMQDGRRHSLSSTSRRLVCKRLSRVMRSLASDLIASGNPITHRKFATCKPILWIRALTFFSEHEKNNLHRRITSDASVCALFPYRHCLVRTGACALILQCHHGWCSNAALLSKSNEWQTYHELSDRNYQLAEQTAIGWESQIF